MDAMTSLAMVTPELVLSAGALVVLMIAAFSGDHAARFATWTGVAFLALATFLLCRTPHGAPFAATIKIDAFAQYAKAIIFGASAVALLIAPRFFETHRMGSDGYRAEYPALILLASVGMAIMVSANDLLAMYVGLELNSLAAYVMASMMPADKRSSEAGLKYFVLGALASGMLLYGMSLLYGFTGTTDFGGMASVATGKGLNAGLLFGLVFVLAGLSFKVSAVPFHMWTPDVYEGAPTPVTAFFASAPKVAALAMFARLMVDGLPGLQHDWQQVLMFVALASILLGAVGAIGQRNVKRLLAYSSINNVGFALIGLIAANKAGITALLVYLAVYAVMTLGAFICILQMRDRDGQQIEDINALAGLAKTQPGLAAALAMFMFSIAGIPPLFGFWPKYMVFDAAVSAGLFPLAVGGIILSVIGAFYYLRLVKIMYFDAPVDRIAPRATMTEEALVGLSAAAISPVGYLTIPALTAAAGAAAAAIL